MDKELEVYRALREAQTRYTYFMLAAAGAAIGFALNQTQTAAMQYQHVPLGVAVLCWGLSFFCGSKHLGYVGSSLYANAELLQVQGGTHPKVGQHPQLMAAASDGIRAALETNGNRASQFAIWQFRLLVYGAVCYVAWHALQMYLRTV